MQITTKGAALDLAGETAEAEGGFIEADRLQPDRLGGHLYSLGGILWGDLLLRTGRLAAARQLTAANRAICEVNRWNDDIARCDRLLARCDLAEDDLSSAQGKLDSAAGTFDDGDFLIELAMTLPDIAEHRRLSGDPDDAERLCTETIKLAEPRQLVPSHARALSVRAKVTRVWRAWNVRMTSSVSLRMVIKKQSTTPRSAATRAQGANTSRDEQLIVGGRSGRPSAGAGATSPTGAAGSGSW